MRLSSHTQGHPFPKTYILTYKWFRVSIQWLKAHKFIDKWNKPAMKNYPVNKSVQNVIFIKRNWGRCSFFYFSINNYQ